MVWCVIVCVWQLAKESLQQLTEWTAICAAKRVDKGRHCGRNSFAALLAFGFRTVAPATHRILILLANPTFCRKFQPYPRLLL